MQPRINGNQENQNWKSIPSKDERWACIWKAKIWQFGIHVLGLKEEIINWPFAFVVKRVASLQSLIRK